MTQQDQPSTTTTSESAGLSPGPALPESSLLQRQANWLAPARSELLRRAHIARRRHVLDLGSGYGAVMPELARRAGGHVIALDRVWEALRVQSRLARTDQVAADALRLPFASATLDLVFSQVTLLWVAPLGAALSEVWRVLMPGGLLIALEPDYGGMIEHPPEVSSRSLWLAGLQRAGADPYVGRKLPGLLARQGFRVSVSLFDTLFEAETARFAFLRGLPLTEDERRQLDEREQAAKASVGTWQQVAHLPFFLVRATKP